MDGRKYKVAVVGATGKVGREMLNVLAERKFPVEILYPLASRKSAGKDITYGEKEVLKVLSLDDFDFTEVDIALFSAGSAVSSEYASKVAYEGCVVIDNTSYFRMDEQVPLVIPEVNPEDIELFSKKNIIANPNCSTIQMLVAVAPLYNLSRIKRIVVSTYQSVSGAGKDAMDDLYHQTKDRYMSLGHKPKFFERQIAFNCIPQIDVMLEDGSTKEEWKIAVESKKILDKDVKVAATCVRVPVFLSHSEAVNIEFEDPISKAEAEEALSEAEGVVLVEDNYVTPVEAIKEDGVFVCRVREDKTVACGLSMWVVSDNLRKGAALNSVQIAERLIKLDSFNRMCSDAL